MANLLILNSLISGRKIKEKKLNKIKNIFEKNFSSVNLISTNIDTDIRALINKEKTHADVLIMIGGDGYINKIINILNEENFFPTLGFLPGGTLSGFRKKLCMSKNIIKEANTLDSKRVLDLPLMSINDKLALYFISFGAYSDISYITKNKKKKVLGFFSYYLEAIKRVFKKKRFKATFNINGSEETHEFPFYMLLDGSHVAGFRVNKNYFPNNSSLNLFITPDGAFNGLLKYLNKKVKVKECDELMIKNLSENFDYCLDGEKYFFEGLILIKRENQKFKFLSNEKFYTKYNKCKF